MFLKKNYRNIRAYWKIVWLWEAHLDLTWEKELFGTHGLVTYALLACGLVIVCVKFWRFHVSKVMLLMLAFDAIAGLVVNAVFVQEM